MLRIFAISDHYFYYQMQKNFQLYVIFTNVTGWRPAKLLKTTLIISLGFFCIY